MGDTHPKRIWADRDVPRFVPGLPNRHLPAIHGPSELVPGATAIYPTVRFQVLFHALRRCAAKH